MRRKVIRGQAEGADSGSKCGTFLTGDLQLGHLGMERCGE